MSELLGRYNNFLISVGQSVFTPNKDFTLELNEIFLFIKSFDQNNIRMFTHLINAAADHKIQMNKVAIIGDGNNILAYELLTSICNVGWVDFVSDLILDEKIRSHYFEVNKLEKNYNDILMSPFDFKDISEYDYVICNDNIIEAEYGPVMSFISEASTKTIKSASRINCVWDQNKFGDYNTLTGYFM